MKMDAAMVLGIVVIAGILSVAGCAQKSQSKPVQAAGNPARTDATAVLPQIALEAGVVSTPILMVWRDKTTGEIKSRMLPRETKAGVAVEPVGNPGSSPVVPPTQVDIRAAVALK